MSLFSIQDYEDYALNNLESGIRDYMFKGAQNDVTLRANEDTFRQLRIRPRYMVDVSKRNLQINIFGDTITCPVCVSPTGLHSRFHENAELETAKG